MKHRNTKVMEANAFKTEAGTSSSSMQKANTIRHLAKRPCGHDASQKENKYNSDAKRKM